MIKKILRSVLKSHSFESNVSIEFMNARASKQIQIETQEESDPRWLNSNPIESQIKMDEGGGGGGGGGERKSNKSASVS